MKMSELVEGLDYQVKIKPDRYDYRRTKGTGRCILVAKEWMEVPEHEKTKTRKVAMAEEYMGYPTKTVMRKTTKWNQETFQYEPTEEPEEVRDYDAGQQQLWRPVWVRISAIIRPWEEYVEEKEIEEEIRAQQREREQELERQAEQIHQDKVDKVKQWLDDHYPEHGISFEVSRYGVSLYASRQTSNIDWWLSFVDAMEGGGDEKKE